MILCFLTHQHTETRGRMVNGSCRSCMVAFLHWDGWMDGRKGKGGQKTMRSQLPGIVGNGRERITDFSRWLACLLLKRAPRPV